MFYSENESVLMPAVCYETITTAPLLKAKKRALKVTKNNDAFIIYKMSKTKTSSMKE